MKPSFHNDRLPTAALLTAACVLLTGCGEYLDTSYGQRRGVPGRSIHGTGVLADMFEQRGHDVFSWSILSPRLQQNADCIVWFPDNHDLPGDEVCSWLEDWLGDRPGRRGAGSSARWAWGSPWPAWWESRNCWSTPAASMRPRLSPAWRGSWGDGWPGRGFVPNGALPGPG